MVSGDALFQGVRVMHLSGDAFADARNNEFILLTWTL